MVLEMIVTACSAPSCISELLYVLIFIFFSVEAISVFAAGFKQNLEQRSEILISCVGDPNHVWGWLRCLCVHSLPSSSSKTLPENKRAHLEPEISSSKSALCVTTLNIPEDGSGRRGKCVHSSCWAFGLGGNHSSSFEGKNKGRKWWIL